MYRESKKKIPSETETDLSGFPLFKTLNYQENIQLNLDKTYQFYAKNEIVYQEGSRMKGFFCITKGILKLYKTGADGKEQILRFVQPGEIIGYHALICGETASTSAQAMEISVLCHIPYKTLLILLQNNWEFSQNMLLIACQELSETTKYLTSIAQKKARENLAEVLLSLGDKFTSDHSNTLQISLTRQELANMTGTAKETVIRLLSEFRKGNLIDTRGGRIKLLDVPKLQKIADP